MQRRYLLDSEIPRLWRLLAVYELFCRLDDLIERDALGRNIPVGKARTDHGHAAEGLRP